MLKFLLCFRSKVKICCGDHKLSQERVAASECGKSNTNKTGMILQVPTTLKEN
jgi:hypothetical protein